MPTLKLSIILEEDNKSLPGFPIVRRLVVNESNKLTFEQVTGASFVAPPGIPAAMGAMQAFMITADQAIALQLNNAGSIPLNAGGVLILIDANVVSAPFAAIQNNSGNQANLKGLVAGT